MDDVRSEAVRRTGFGQALSASDDALPVAARPAAQRQPTRMLDVWRRDAVLGAEPAPGGWADRLIAWAKRYPTALLWLAIALGVLARVFLVIHTNAMIDGDEALVGIQAEGILRGHFPTYFPGQA